MPYDVFYDVTRGAEADTTPFPKRHAMQIPEYFYRIDIHTHTPHPDHEAIVNITPRQDFGDNQRYSVGIHPWDAAIVTDSDWQRLTAMAADPRCVAIGECGLDTKHKSDTDTPAAPLSVQETIFRRQIQLAESVAKPLIIHCVGAIDTLLKIKRETNPKQPWILHGFRGKPQQAQQLTAHGLILSLGLRHNPAVPGAIPATHLLHETDAQ